MANNEETQIKTITDNTQGWKRKKASHRVTFEGEGVN